MDEVLSANDSLLAQDLLDLSVVEEGNTGSSNLQETTLVDELLDGLEGGVSPGDVGLDDLEHGEGSLVQANEDSVVDLTETQQLEDLAGLGGNSEDTGT